jgi:hypothetical protein
LTLLPLTQLSFQGWEFFPQGRKTPFLFESFFFLSVKISYSLLEREEGRLWLMPVILLIQEAAIRRIVVQSQPWGK